MIKNSFSLLARFIGRFIPRNIQRVIYKFPIVLINKKLAPEKACAWCKNSVALDDFIFGVSDLDVSILLIDGLDLKKMRSLLNYLKFLKRIFPFMGETSIYHESDFSWLCSLINPAELRRDPELLKRFSKIGCLKELTFSQKRAFAIHWLMSDHKKMHQNYNQRKLKIKRFSSLLGWDRLKECNDYAAFTKVFLNYLFETEEDRQKFQDLWLKISQFLEHNDHQGLLSFYRQYQEREFLISYFPAVWLGPSVELGLISEELLLIEKMSKNPEDNKSERDYKNVMEEMLSWEAWGLYTQQLFHADSVEMAIHLGHLKKVAAALGNQEIVEAYASLESNHSKNFVSGELCVS